MRVLFLYFETTIRYPVQAVLEIEDYIVIATRQATEVIHIIEESNDSYVLLTDNFGVNPEAIEALAVLRQRPELRQRVRVIGISGRSDVASTPWMTDGLMDAHLPLPYTYDQLLDIVKANSGGAPP